MGANEVAKWNEDIQDLLKTDLTFFPTTSR